MKKFICLLLPIMMAVAVFGGCGVAEKTNDNNLNNKEIIETKYNEVSNKFELKNNSDDKGTNFSESTSNMEIINSVLSSLDRSFSTGNGYTSYNFIDDNIGFFFYLGGNENRLQIFMKTSDGGSNWHIQTVVSGPSMHWKEKIICAKMVTEDVGLVSGNFYADTDNIRNRTYITSNGGMTWYAAEVDRNILCCAEAYDIIYHNDEYILCFREKYLSDGSYEYKYYRFASKDLQTWTLIEE